MTVPIRVLHVDDDPGVLALVARYVESERENLTITTETDPTVVPDRIADEPVDCVVSDYQMPDMDGLTLLERIRAKHPDLPFILFTGRGSEDVASRAISAGVTDYLQKGGTETYELLANRVEKAVDRHRAHQETERILAGFRRIADSVSDPIISVDREGTVVYANPGVERVLGYDPAELEGASVTELLTVAEGSSGEPLLAPDGSGMIPPEDPARSGEEAGSRSALGGDDVDWRTVPVRGRRADGEQVPLDVSYTAIDLGDGPVFTGIVRERDGAVEGPDAAPAVGGPEEWDLDRPEGSEFDRPEESDGDRSACIRGVDRPE